MIERGSGGSGLKAEVLRELTGLASELRDVARGIRESPWLEDGDAEDFEARAGEVSGLVGRLEGAVVVEPETNSSYRAPGPSGSATADGG